MHLAPRVMERCPVELWAKIVSYACTDAIDGGYTACSLPLVSRSMRDIVQPYRYQTVALTRVTACVTLARQLKQLRAAPAIHYLLVSVQSPPLHWGEKQLTGEEQSTLNAALAAIVRTAAPTLRTCIFHEVPFLFLDHIGEALMPAPFLEDLSMPNMHNWPCLISTASSPQTSQFLSLRRLHLSDCDSTEKGVLWDKLAALAPALTHLRLTGIRQDTHVSLFLRVLLDVRREPPIEYPLETNPPSMLGSDDLEGDERTQAVFRASKLPGLKHVFIQPAAPLQDCGPFARSMMMEWFTKDALSGLAADFACSKVAGDFYLLPQMKGYRIGDSEALEDWLDLIDGGQGPWSQPPAA